mgnify:CR=1 FL=1
MSLDEALNDNPPVTRQQALAEIARHGISIAEFDADMGVHDEYNAADVLGWLGY